MNWLEFPGRVDLQGSLQAPGRVHLFDKDSVDAVNGALAANRPLLIRGEPGVGKTQLAAAAARKLGRAFVWLTVDSRTEARDLLWRFDAIRRLAQAQLGDKVDLAELDVARFVEPGPLWWAFNWKSAAEQAKRSYAPVPPLEGVETDQDGTPRRGCVVLIDEIDKGESDVPNGLLEALGSGSFPRYGSSVPVTIAATPPLVIITTNAERTLPDAFLRRCLVLRMVHPERKSKDGVEQQAPDPLIAWLIERGAAHFPGLDAVVIRRAAEMLSQDRDRLPASGPRPGQAEFLDILRAVAELAPGDSNAQCEKLDTLRPFILNKYASDRHAGRIP